jgi:hypothetical protein
VRFALLASERAGYKRNKKKIRTYMDDIAPSWIQNGEASLGLRSSAITRLNLFLTAGASGYDAKSDFQCRPPTAESPSAGSPIQAIRSLQHGHASPVTSPTSRASRAVHSTGTAVSPSGPSVGTAEDGSVVFTPASATLAQLVEVSRGLLENYSLRSLELHRCNVDGSAAMALAQAVAVNQYLLELGLSRNPVGPEGVGALAAALQVNQTLHELDASWTGVDDASAAQLAEALLVNTSLQRLYLERNHIGPDGAGALALALRENSKLQALSLAGNNIGTLGCSMLGLALADAHGLKSLDVAGNNLPETAVCCLVRGLCARPAASNGLTSLNLSCNVVGDAVALLALALENPACHLRELNLSRSRLAAGAALRRFGAALRRKKPDDAAKSSPTAAAPGGLVGLSLADNDLTDEAMFDLWCGRPPVPIEANASDSSKKPAPVSNAGAQEATTTANALDQTPYGVFTTLRYLDLSNNELVSLEGADALVRCIERAAQASVGGKDMGLPLETLNLSITSATTAAPFTRCFAGPHGAHLLLRAAGAAPNLAILPIGGNGMDASALKLILETRKVALEKRRAAASIGAATGAAAVFDRWHGLSLRDGRVLAALETLRSEMAQQQAEINALQALLLEQEAEESASAGNSRVVQPDATTTPTRAVMRRSIADGTSAAIDATRRKIMLMQARGADKSQKSLEALILAQPEDHLLRHPEVVAGFVAYLATACAPASFAFLDLSGCVQVPPPPAAVSETGASDADKGRAAANVPLLRACLALIRGQRAARPVIVLAPDVVLDVQWADAVRDAAREAAATVSGDDAGVHRNSAVEDDSLLSTAWHALITARRVPSTSNALPPLCVPPALFSPTAAPDRAATVLAPTAEEEAAEAEANPDSDPLYPLRACLPNAASSGPIRAIIRYSPLYAPSRALANYSLVTGATSGRGSRQFEGARFEAVHALCFPRAGAPVKHSGVWRDATGAYGFTAHGRLARRALIAAEVRHGRPAPSAVEIENLICSRRQQATVGPRPTSAATTAAEGNVGRLMMSAHQMRREFNRLDTAGCSYIPLDRIGDLLTAVETFGVKTDAVELGRLLEGLTVLVPATPDGAGDDDTTTVGASTLPLTPNVAMTVAGAPVAKHQVNTTTAAASIPDKAGSAIVGVCPTEIPVLTFDGYCALCLRLAQR